MAKFWVNVFFLLLCVLRVFRIKVWLLPQSSQSFAQSSARFFGSLWSKRQMSKEQEKLTEFTDST